MRILAAVTSAVLVGLLLLPCAARADCVPYQDYLHCVAGISLPGGPGAAAVAGNLLVVAAGMKADFVDITHPETPRLRCSRDMGNGCYSVAVSGHYAFVTTLSGLAVFDLEVGDPMCPTIVATLDVGPGAIVISGSYAYIGRDLYYGGALEVVDIADPTHPVAVGHLSLQERVWSLGVAGNYAYLSEDWWFTVVDVSNPGLPNVVARVNMGAGATGVTCSGHYAYRAGNGGLDVIDIADPLHPRLVSRLPLEGGSSVTISGTWAYVGGLDFYVVDVADPASPRLAATWMSDMSVSGTACSGNYAYALFGAGAGEGNLEVFNVANPEPVVPIARLETPNGNEIDGIATSGTHAYLAEGSGFQIVDLTDLANPRVTADLAPPYTYSFYSVAVSGRYAYAGGAIAPDTPGIAVIDVADPAAPRVVGTLETGLYTAVAASGAWVYATGSAGPGLDAGLEVIDAGDPAHPHLVGSVPLACNLQYAVAVSGEFAYVATDAGLQVVDVSVPEDPRVVASVPTVDDALDVVLRGDRAYVTAGFGGVYPGRLYIINIRNPRVPLRMATIPLAQGSGRLTVSGSFAFVVGDLFAVEVIDIDESAHAAPETASWVVHPRGIGGIACDYTVDLAVADGCVLAGGTFLDVLPMQCEEMPLAASVGRPVADPASAVVSILPNPSGGTTSIRFEMPRAGRVHATVYEPSGRRVRSLVDQDVAGGPCRLAWDGRNDEGSLAAAGVYFVRIVTPEGARTGRVVLMR